MSWLGTWLGADRTDGDTGTRATRPTPTPWGPGQRATGPSTPVRSSSPPRLGALILSVTVDDAANRMTSGQVATDAAFGALCCISLWWRRRWPFGVALVCVLLGAFSTFGTVAGLLALSSLAVHRHVRPALLVAALFVPSAVVCSIWLGRTNTWSVMLPTAALAAAATAWGMFVRARRQLLATLRDRAQRAEADQLLRAEQCAPGRADPDRAGDARRARPPDLADGAARRGAGGRSPTCRPTRCGRPPS